MPRLDPHPLPVTLLLGVHPDGLLVPRRYTVTPSNRTGDLFLSIGRTSNTQPLQTVRKATATGLPVAPEGHTSPSPMPPTARCIGRPLPLAGP
jgi:hypothetical protein